MEIENRSAMKLEFVGVNTTVLSEPLVQGVIRSVKHLHRKNFLRRMRLAMESGKTYNTDRISTTHLLAYS